MKVASPAMPKGTRAFDIDRDARRFVFFTDGRRMLESVAVRGFVGNGRPDAHAALKLLDCAEDLPVDRGEELLGGRWYSLTELRTLAVIEAEVEEA